MSARAVMLAGSLVALGAAAYLLLRPGQARAAAQGGAALDGMSGWVLPDYLADTEAAAPSFFGGNDADLAMELDPARDVPALLSSAADSVLAAVDDLSFSLVGFRVMGNRWKQAAADPKNAAYVAAAHAAEQRIGAPVDLIVRQIWQESRFNPQAFNAGSGASGIMQIVPRWHPDANVWDPLAAIDYGASYLGQLYRKYGTWELALKAYNWGPGNVDKWLAGNASQPLETLNYSAQILADIGGGGGVYV